MPAGIQEAGHAARANWLGGMAQVSELYPVSRAVQEREPIAGKVEGTAVATGHGRAGGENFVARRPYGSKLRLQILIPTAAACVVIVVSSASGSMFPGSKPSGSRTRTIGFGQPRIIS